MADVDWFVYTSAIHPHRSTGSFLANVNVHVHYVLVDPSVVCNVRALHPTKAIEIFGNVSRPFGSFKLGHPLTST